MKIGRHEIAQRLGVAPKTVNKWIERSRKGEMTDPFPYESGVDAAAKPLWQWAEVRRWALRTKRLHR